MEASTTVGGVTRATKRARMTEADAVKLALEGTIAQRVGAGARALVTLMRDTSKTEQVFLMGVLLSGPFFPGLLAKIASSEGGLELLRDQPSIDSRSVDFAALRALPVGTLGRAYASYLDENHLDPDLFQAPPGLPPVVQTVARRIRQTHDIWHVLTGYRPDVAGELALQGFTFAQLSMPSSFLIATFGTLVKAPREARAVLEGYRRGRAAAFLAPVRFERMWERPLADVQRELSIRPASGAGTEFQKAA